MWIVAHQPKKDPAEWQNPIEYNSLDNARIDMHARMGQLSVAEAALIAVFPGRRAFKNEKYRYYIDRRDKSQAKIGGAAGGIIGSLPSDFF